MIMTGMAILAMLRLSRLRLGWRAGLWAAFVTLVLMAVGAGWSAYGQSPPYVVLHGPRTSVPSHHHAKPLPPSNHEISVSRAGYAYGWFGAQPRRSGSIHRGYRQNYILWTVE